MVRDTTILERFDADHPVVGMVHLPALPGAPAFDGDRDAVRTRALEDARRLEAGGIDGLIVENFGDAPFYPEDVPKHVVAEMTALASTLTDAVDVPVGINVLRNDAAAAISIAAAADAAFVRINVHVGTAATDQGLLEGRAHETLRLRDRLEADVGLLADVHVKHASPIGERDIDRAALETIERGRADGVIVSGPETGVETPLAEIERVSEALADRGHKRAPVFVGSGVTSDTANNCLEAGADGIIVGTALKMDDEAANPISAERVADLVATVQDSINGDSSPELE
ncbi:BtpA/SgcQ family protein [Natrinema halophilum]|uniref:BtpA/SgcQ family protein n=1 Tax=Natrinema halophilum TaxID=1699371 RepID=A0A7D5GJS1_9EURY|nr:BtpA/SgcQ family protein [Natrinema halophilum]QLG50827.1 BtpA/SgcQ family protein [Natrinema halophilum]